MEELKYIAHPFIRPKSMEYRAYQVNIVNSCIKRSTLVVLPTALGKTICAACVIALRLEKYGAGKIVFLAPTKPLIEQHYKVLRKHLMIDKIVMFTGEVAPKKREALWHENTIIISTPQIIQNDLISGKINLKDVLLIIFDEAHRAVGNYAYVFVAENYRNQGEHRLVMGITASPGSDPEKIFEVCTNLDIEGVEIRSEYDPDVMPYIQNIGVRYVPVEVPPAFRKVSSLLQSVLTEKIEALHKFGFLLRRKRASVKDLLGIQKAIHAKIVQEGKSRSSSYYQAASVVASAIKINHALELVETQSAVAVNNFLEKLEAEATCKGGSKAARSLLNEPRVLAAIKLAKQLPSDHPKLSKTAEIVQSQLKLKPDSRIIVFTNYRNTAELVLNRLNTLPGVNSVRFVGQASRNGDIGLKQKEQVELIQKFKRGEFNVLVATSVAEEGLDIPETDLVIFYEPVPSEIRLIQRRGRTGRRQPGNVVILVTKHTRDEVYSYASKSKERRMHRHLKLLREALKQNQKLIVSDPSVSTPPTLKPSFGIATKRPMDKSGTIGRKPTGIVSHGTIAGDEKVQLEPPKKKGQVKLTDYTTSRNSSDCTGTTGTTNAKNCDCSGSGSNSQNPAIIVDNREFMSEVVRELYRQGAKVNREQLKVGDYVISDRICIERKEATDFLDSLVGGRLFQQLKYLKNNYVCPIFILEGYGILTRRQIDKNAVFGALASIVADFNIPVITTKDCKETAEVIFSIAKREHKVKREVGLRNIKNSMGLHERQQFIIEGLPHISGVLAKRLLTHFGSVESVMNANASELLKVAGIGKKTAEDIRRVIEAQYNNGNE